MHCDMKVKKKRRLRKGSNVAICVAHVSLILELTRAESKAQERARPSKVDYPVPRPGSRRHLRLSRYRHHRQKLAPQGALMSYEHVHL